MKTRIKVWLLFILLPVMLFTVPANGAERSNFEQTIAHLQKALLEKDLQTVKQHLDLNGILTVKIKKFSLAGLLPGSEAALSRAAVNFIEKQYARSTPATRLHYFKQFKINQMGSQGDFGFISASFMGSPTLLSALRNKKGDWVIIGVESPVINGTLGSFLKTLGKK